jgi:hypothetical protein
MFAELSAVEMIELMYYSIARRARPCSHHYRYGGLGSVENYV